VQYRPQRRTYTASEMYAQHRGGGVFTRFVSQRGAALLAAAAANRGLHPSTITLLGGALALVSSICAAIAGVRGTWQLGVVALIGWQIAYIFDCADGQLARTTGKASVHGGRLDMLVDLAAQIFLVAAVAQIIVVRSDAEPILVGAFASAWLVNLFISVMASGQGAQSIIDSRSPLVQVAKATRDYGVMTLALGLLVILWTSGVIFFAYFYLVLNMIVLILSIYKTARLGYRN